MNANMDNSEIKATVLPVPDEGLKEEMRRYWKELKKWMIIGMIVCVISLLLAVIGTLLFVRKSQSYPQMPSFSQIRFIEETPQFPKALFAPQSYHSQFSINKRAGIFYFKLALFVFICGIYPLVMIIINDYFVDCWDYFKKKHPVLQEAVMKIEIIPAVTYCEDCRSEYETVKYGKICPHCKSERTFLIQGNECTIKEIEAETEE